MTTITYEEQGVDITIDTFELSLPSLSSYPDPSAPCEELVQNGDAESNGFNPYPMTASKSNEEIQILEENGNKFFSLSNRGAQSSSIKYSLDTSCLTRGVSYIFSSRMRLHLTPGFVGGAEKMYWFIEFKNTDGGSSTKEIVNCDAQSVSDGWVTCTGIFMIDEKLSLARGSTASLRMSFKNIRDGEKYDVDYDDISIRYHQGYVDELIVESSDVSCWGSGADVHVTPAIYYQSSYAGSDLSTQIQNVTNNGDGSSSLMLKNAATLPIVSEENDYKTAVEVVLLSRNLIIEGDADGGSGRGGYMQVLHTPNIPQTIEGVRFVNMGRKAEVDKFVSDAKLQHKYVTLISHIIQTHPHFETCFHRHCICSIMAMLKVRVYQRIRSTNPIIGV